MAQTQKRQGQGYWVEKNLLTKYGMSLEDYAWRVHGQKGRCLLCGEVPNTKRGLVVDHDHKNGRVRGLLCSPCNSFLGFYEKLGYPTVEEYLAR